MKAAAATSILALAASCAQPPDAAHIQVPCPGAHAELWLVAGQSNVAGTAEHPATIPPGEVVQFHRGRCYLPTMPILGASTMPTDRPHFNPMVYTAFEYSARTGVPVVLSFAAVGGTSIVRWSNMEDLGGELLDAAQDLSRLGPITRFLWQQGETDALADMPAADYEMHLSRVLETVRAAGFGGRAHVARSSRCYGVAWENPVGRVQERYGGPDTDVLGLEYRHDKCHFNAEGVVRASAIWNDNMRRGG